MTYLVHSLYIFLLQIFLAFQDLVYVWDTSHFFDTLGIEGYERTVPYSFELLAGLDRNSYRPPYIPSWYLFLVGELQLRVDPDFTVQALLQCLLALSGSFFLLIIRYDRSLSRCTGTGTFFSGHVRNAYFKFYFSCLQRKHEHSSVNVFQVTAGRQNNTVSSGGLQVQSTYVWSMWAK